MRKLKVLRKFETGLADEMQKVAAAVTAALSEVPSVLQPVRVQTIPQIRTDIRAGRFLRNRDFIYEIVSFNVYEEDKAAFESAFNYFAQQAPPFLHISSKFFPLSAIAKLTTCI